MLIDEGDYSLDIQPDFAKPEFGTQEEFMSRAGRIFATACVVVVAAGFAAAYLWAR